MRFVTYRRDDGEHVGVLSAAGTEVIGLTGIGVCTDMLDLIRRYGDLAPAIDAAMARCQWMPLAACDILAPIPRPPRNIFCVGKNYSQHAHEFGRSGFDRSATGSSAVPDAPIIFSKPPSSVLAPGVAIPRHLDPTDSVDYEGELGVVIGRSGRVAGREDAMAFVFGYTLLNDVTARELQKRHAQWLLGKGIDGFCPMGPAIVHRDGIAALESLRIETRVNGELRQSATLDQLIFDIPTLIATIGRAITLEPGDVIATGTPAGVGIGFTPPRYLRRGDTVQIEVPGIGILENPVA